MGKISDSIKADYTGSFVINVKFPYDTEKLICLLNLLPQNEKTVCFSGFCVETAKIIILILNKNLETLLEKSPQTNVSPHIAEAFEKDFKIKFIN